MNFKERGLQIRFNKSHFESFDKFLDNQNKRRKRRQKQKERCRQSKQERNSLSTSNSDIKDHKITKKYHFQRYYFQGTSILKNYNKNNENNTLSLTNDNYNHHYQDQHISSRKNSFNELEHNTSNTHVRYDDTTLSKNITKENSQIHLSTCDTEVIETIKIPKIEPNTNETSEEIAISNTNNNNELNESIDSEDVICLGDLEKSINEICSDDDIDDNLDEEMKSLNNSTNQTQSIDSSQSKRNRSACAICDKLGHKSMQCLMICMNCNGPYHNMRTCPRPRNNRNKLYDFMEFSLKHYKNI